jgi:aromatic ring-opening dioxygenase catalytic subunit (LigB family)
MTTTASSITPCLAFNHGGGSNRGVTDFLQEYVRSLPQRPSGIVVVEAHVQSTPVLVGGDAKLTAEADELIRVAGFSTKTSNKLFDAHGTQDAKTALVGIPIISVSVMADENARGHLSLGEALAPLRERGNLILGSCLPSFHNFSYFFSRSAETKRTGGEHSHIFDGWLREAPDSNADFNHNPHPTLDSGQPSSFPECAFAEPRFMG